MRRGVALRRRRAGIGSCAPAERKAARHDAPARRRSSAATRAWQRPPSRHHVLPRNPARATRLPTIVIELRNPAHVLSSRARPDRASYRTDVRTTLESALLPPLRFAAEPIALPRVSRSSRTATSRARFSSSLSPAARPCRITRPSALHLLPPPSMPVFLPLR